MLPGIQKTLFLGHFSFATTLILKLVHVIHGLALATLPRKTQGQIYEKTATAVRNTGSSTRTPLVKSTSATLLPSPDPVGKMERPSSDPEKSRGKTNHGWGDICQEACTIYTRPFSTPLSSTPASTKHQNVL